MKEVSCNGTTYMVPDYVNYKCPESKLIHMLPAKNPWSVIHRRLFNATDWNADDQRKWYEQTWLDSLPNCGSCRIHWRELTASKPIDWSAAESASRSLWELHNIVSEKHANNETIPYEQAKALWQGPRVAFISIDYATHGGTETFHRTLIPRLRHFRNIVGFGAMTGGGNASYLRVPYFQGNEEVKQLCTLADVVVTWGISDLKHLLPDKRPKVIAVHHSDRSNEWNNNTILDQLDTVDRVVCVNRQVAEQMQSTGKPSFYIPNAVDPERLKVTESINTEGKRVCLFGHRMVADKRPELAVEIAKLLPDDWVMVMAGEGPQKPQDLPSNVRMVGHLDTLANWLAVADCFISTSKFDGFGLSMAEAHAMGVPIVATPVGIAPEVATIRIGHNADPALWASAIVVAGLEKAPQANYSLESHVKQWAKVLTLGDPVK